MDEMMLRARQHEKNI